MVNFRGRLVVIGGLSAAGTSTASVFALDRDGHMVALPPLPGPVHDAAAAVLDGRLMLVGGGQFEGSDRIIQVAPGRPHIVGTLPQALSDLDAVSIDDRAFVAGGWNGTVTNRDIYAVSPSGSVSLAGRIPTGVRYAAVAALAGRVLIAGGELASGAPTKKAYAFEPRTGRLAPLPGLPAATDHAAGVALGDTFYVIGGLRRGVPTRAILAWRPGQSHWRPAGRLPHTLADAAATVFAGDIALAGGRDHAVEQTAVTRLSP